MVILIFESPFSPPSKEALCDLKPRSSGRNSVLLSHVLYSTELQGCCRRISVLWRRKGAGGGAEGGIENRYFSEAVFCLGNKKPFTSYKVLTKYAFSGK